MVALRCDASCEEREAEKTPEVARTESTVLAKFRVRKSNVLAPNDGRRIWKCVKLNCGREFRRIDNLGYHIKTCHMGRFTCERLECRDWGFHVEQDLTWHQEAGHVGRSDYDYKWECPDCEQLLSKQEQVHYHSRHTHTGTYLCSFEGCDGNFAYASSDALSRHRLIAHGTGTHKCSHPGCPVSAMSKRRIDEHHRAWHRQSVRRPRESVYQAVQDSQTRHMTRSSNTTSQSTRSREARNEAEISDDGGGSRLSSGEDDAEDEIEDNID